MRCDEYVHEGLKSFRDINCPFCDDHLNAMIMIHESYECCAGMNVKEDGMMVCIDCGMVHSGVFECELLGMREMPMGSGDEELSEFGCNKYVHEEFRLLGDMSCTFCDRHLDEIESVKESYRCCVGMNVEEGDLMVCVSCGVVHSGVFKGEYVDFHRNVYKIRRKSAYQRRYHVDYHINKKRFRLRYSERKRVLRYFRDIDRVLDDGSRNRYPIVGLLIL